MHPAFVIFMDDIKNNITNQIVVPVQSLFPLSRLITGFVTGIKTTGVTSGAGTSYHSGAHESTTVY